ncbi:MAG: hypothetical protein RL367_1121 [Pseudomonadota bacterium]
MFLERKARKSAPPGAGNRLRWWGPTKNACGSALPLPRQTLFGPSPSRFARHLSRRERISAVNRQKMCAYSSPEGGESGSAAYFSAYARQGALQGGPSRGPFKAHDRLSKTLLRRIEPRISRRIIRPTRGENRLQILDRSARAGHRSQIALGYNTSHMILWFGFEPDRMGRCEQRIIERAISDNSPRCRNDRGGVFPAPGF